MEAKLRNWRGLGYGEGEQRSQDSVTPICDAERAWQPEVSFGMLNRHHS